MKHVGFLAILFVALLAAVIVKESSRPDAGALRDEVPLERLFSATAAVDDVASIAVSGPGEAAGFKLQNVGDRWLVTEPFRAPAAAGKVQELIELIAAARGEVRLDDAAKLRKFDLGSDGAVRVVLAGAGGDELANIFVGRTSGQGGAFVRLPSHPDLPDAALAVSQDLRGALGLPRTGPGDSEPAAAEPDHFHDKSVAPVATEDVTRIELVTPHWTIALEQDAEGADWKIVEGDVGVPLKAAGAKQLLDQLRGGITAQKLVDPAQRGELGLDAAPYRATAILADGTRRSVVGVADDENEKFHVRLDVEQDPDVIYECARWAFNRTFPAGSTMFEFERLEVADEGLGRIVVTRDGQTLDMVRPGGKPASEWELREPAWPLEVRTSQLRSIGALLRSVRPIDFVAGAPEFATEVEVRYGADDAKTEDMPVIQIGPKAKTGVGRLGILPGTPELVVVLTDNTADRVAPDLLTLFEPNLVHGIEREELTTVVVAKPGGADGSLTESYRLEREEGEWQLVQGETRGRAKALEVSDWLDAVFELEATARTDYAGDGDVVIELTAGDGDPVTLGLNSGDDGAPFAVAVGGFAFVVKDSAKAAAPEAEKLAAPPEPTDDEESSSDENGADETDDDEESTDGTDDSE